MKDTLRTQLANVRMRTLAVLDAMPAGRFEFQPWPGSMSFGDQLRHIASAERTLIQALREGNWVWDQGINRESHPDPASVRALLEQTSQELQHLLSGLTEARLAEPVSVPWSPAQWTPAGIIVEWIAHESHHTGQLYLHLRLCGITPPPYEGS